jgi:hypothetical protein
MAVTGKRQLDNLLNKFIPFNPLSLIVSLSQMFLKYKQRKAYSIARIFLKICV